MQLSRRSLSHAEMNASDGLNGMHNYANATNRFWKTLYSTGLTPRQLAPADFGLLLSFGIGLTDIVKGQAGMDHEVGHTTRDLESLEQKIFRYQPRILCFNGKKAAEIFLGRKSPDDGYQAQLLQNRLKLTITFRVARMAGTAVAARPAIHRQAP